MVNQTDVSAASDFEFLKASRKLLTTEQLLLAAIDLLNPTANKGVWAKLAETIGNGKYSIQTRIADTSLAAKRLIFFYFCVGDKPHAVRMAVFRLRDKHRGATSRNNETPRGLIKKEGQDIESIKKYPEEDSPQKENVTPPVTPAKRTSPRKRVISSYTLSDTEEDEEDPIDPYGLPESPTKKVRVIDLSYVSSSDNRRSLEIPEEV